MLSAVAMQSFRNRLAHSAPAAREKRMIWSSGKIQSLMVSRTTCSMESADSRSFRLFAFSSVASIDYSPPLVDNPMNSKSLIAHGMLNSQKQETDELNLLLGSSSVQDQQEHDSSTLKPGEANAFDVDSKLGGTTIDTNKHCDKISNDITPDKKLENGALKRKNKKKSSKFYEQQVILGKLKRSLSATKISSTASSQNKYGLGPNHRLIQTLFQQAKEEKIDLSHDLYAQCFQSFVQCNYLSDAVDALKGWIALSRATSQGNASDALVPMPPENIFLLLIDALGNNTKLPHHRQIQSKDGLCGIVKDLILMIQLNFPIETSSVQQRTLPHLLCSIVQYTTNDPHLSGIAQKLYHYLMRRQRYSSNGTQETSSSTSSDASPLPPLLIPFDSQIFTEILRHSANQSACYLPVSEILHTLVFDHDVSVDAEIVLTLLQKEYPFVNMDRVVLYLDSIDKMLSETTSGAVIDDFRIDIGLLEQIMIQAARSKMPEIIRRGWNFMERYQYFPTESMYESAIHGFFLTYKSDHFGFAVMKEMESQSGYIPSYDLIRTVSGCLSTNRISTARIDNAYNYILASKANKYITLTSMNCILSAYGQAGCIESAFATFDDLLENGIQPDSNSFAFLLEALSTHVQSCATKERLEKNKHGKYTREETNLYTQHLIESEFAEGEEEDRELMKQEQPWPSADNSDKTQDFNTMDFASHIEAANGILDMMEERGIQMNHRILHQYIRLFVYAGETERAKGILEEIFAKGTCQIRLETLTMVSFHLAVHEGKQEMGMEVANLIFKSGYRWIPNFLRQTLKEKNKVIKST